MLDKAICVFTLNTTGVFHRSIPHHRPDPARVFSIVPPSCHITLQTADFTSIADGRVFYENTESTFHDWFQRSAMAPLMSPMTLPIQINIFEYLDYREFLRDTYAYLKKNQRGFSYRWFAQKAGMSSPNFLKLVIDGRRNLTAQSTEKFSKALDLTTQQAAFFRHLVTFAQATTAAEKNVSYEHISQYRQHRAVRRLERGMFEYLSHWYFPAIRELVGCVGFREDAKQIARSLRPRISVTQVRKALRVLLNLGLLVRNEQGELSLGDPLLSTGPEVRSLAVGNFHRQMMDRASQATETVPPEKREISGVTIALSEDSFARIKARIQALRAEFLELSAQETAPTQVVQINFQAFPLAVTQEDQI